MREIHETIALERLGDRAVVLDSGGLAWQFQRNDPRLAPNYWHGVMASVRLTSEEFQPLLPVTVLFEGDNEIRKRPRRRR